MQYEGSASVYRCHKPPFRLIRNSFKCRRDSQNSIAMPCTTALTQLRHNKVSNSIMKS
jgi:hypothetical protein